MINVNGSYNMPLSNSSNCTPDSSQVSIPPGCSEAQFSYAGKNVLLLGTIHTQDSKDDVLNFAVDNWLKSRIASQTKQTAVLVEMPKAVLEDQSNWDHREMFVAARSAQVNGFHLIATEPTSSSKDSLLSPEFKSKWSEFNGVNIPDEDADKLVDAYLHNIRILHRKIEEGGSPLKTEYIDIVRKYVEDFDERVELQDDNRKGIYVLAPEEWVVDKRVKPCIFNRISSVSQLIRDSSVLESIKALPTADVVVVCGEYHRVSILKLIDDLNKEGLFRDPLSASF